MIRLARAIIFLSAIAGSSTAARAYDICIGNYANYYEAFYVRIGGEQRTFGRKQAECQQTGATGPISAGYSPGALVDCKYAAPQNNQNRITVYYSVINPGIGGVQPVKTCGVTTR